MKIPQVAGLMAGLFSAVARAANISHPALNTQTEWNAHYAAHIHGLIRKSAAHGVKIPTAVKRLSYGNSGRSCNDIIDACYIRSDTRNSCMSCIRMRLIQNAGLPFGIFQVGLMKVNRKNIPVCKENKNVHLCTIFSEIGGI